MIAAPPLETGAVQLMVEVVFMFEVATTLTGAPGTAEGIATADADDSTKVPLAFVAETTKV